MVTCTCRVVGLTTPCPSNPSPTGIAVLSKAALEPPCDRRERLSGDAKVHRRQLSYNRVRPTESVIAP